MSQNFWEVVKQYNELGADPLLWMARCSNEVALPDKVAAAGEVRKAGIRVSPSWFDPYFYMDGKTADVTRRVFDIDKKSAENEVGIKRALAVLRLQQESCEEPARLGESLQGLFNTFGSKLSIASISISATKHTDAQFAMMD